MRRLIIILMALIAASCERDDPSQSHGDPIAFALSVPGLEVTKAEITNDGLVTGVNNGTIGVRLHETLIQDFIYGTRLLPENGSWFPESGHDNKVQWKDKASGDVIPAMSFFAFAFSPFSKYGSDILVGEGSRGRSVTISQPNSYNGADFIDYLLSYEVDIPAQKVDDSHPVIGLQLEHAMTKVELYIDCADAFKDPKYKIEFTDLSFKDVYRKATLTNSHHKKAGENGSNVWTVVYAEGDGSTTNYNWVHSSSSKQLDIKDSGEMKVMEFITFPVNASFSSTLSVAYSIYENTGTDETPVWGDAIASSSSTFVLRNFTPKGWQSGHKVRYSLHIDNGIELTGKITDWIEVDYIEGVIITD
mgnify:CR=1 FL=1